MVQYIRRLEEIPGFSDIPVPGHEKIKVVDKILIDPVTGSRNLMVLWAKLEPESGAALHTHPVEQVYFVLSGALKVRIGGEEFLAEKNSAVLLPAGEEHEVTTQGKEPAVFLTIFAPPLGGFDSRPH